jgi:hypothetical protein
VHIGGGQHKDALRRFMRQHQANPALIAARAPVGCVMQLEDKIAAGLNQLGLTWSQQFGHGAWAIAC